MKKEVWVSLEKKEEKVACWLREQFFVVVVGFVVGVFFSLYWRHCLFFTLSSPLPKSIHWLITSDPEAAE